MGRAEPRRHAPIAVVLLLAACASRAPVPADDAPTLALLRTRSVTIEPDAGVPRDDTRAAAAYRALLERAPAGAPERAPALRRLGDLELELAEQRSGDGAAADPGRAIAHYQAWLAAQPDAEGRDAVLYQLARAHELAGDAGAALATLDRLVQAHPRSGWRDEAEFRRGELLFAARRWADAEAAYGVVLQAGAGSPWRDRALYMQGWSRYRQGRWDDALEALFSVLDLTLGTQGGGERSRAETELVDDTLRVVALSLEQLQGAAAIAPHVQSDRRRGYAFAVYEQLAALYERQGRVRDAADTLQRYADQHPQAAGALLARLRVVELHARAGFATPALQARRDFVRAAAAAPTLDATLRLAFAEQLDLLARHHHAEWQRTQARAEADAAESWYVLAEQHLHDARRGERRFLRAELLFEAGRHAEAAQAYAQAAYGDAGHTRRADAGHGELLALARLPDAAGRARDAAQRFVARFGDDTRALAVRAQLAFDDGDWAAAEQAWTRQLGAASDAAERARIGERIAAALYRQGEAARDAGRLADAAALFARVGRDWPASAAAPAALFDAAQAQAALRQWRAAAESLQALRREHARHALAARAAPQLALALAEDGRPQPAAEELERWAGTLADADAARQARWQAAELYARAGDGPRAAALWQRAVADAQSPLPQAVEARWQLAGRARAAGRTRDEQALLRALRQLDADGGAARTEATRMRAALAALRLAEPLVATYRAQPLAEPLKTSLARKKTRFDAVQAAYAEAAATGSAEGSAAAAVASAALYQDFGRALLAAPPPRGLRKSDLEGYRVLLEEQALPFEDRAVELYAAVALRTREGAWDEPVRQAYAALATLRPLRWGKRESGASAAAAAVRAAREAGRFDEAESLAEQALARDPADAATRLNLGILLDLYRHDAARALPHYRALAGQGPPELPRWIAELEQRSPRQALARPPLESAR